MSFGTERRSKSDRERSRQTTRARCRVEEQAHVTCPAGREDEEKQASSTSGMKRNDPKEAFYELSWV